MNTNNNTNSNNNNGRSGGDPSTVPLTIFTTPTPFWILPQEVRYHMCRPLCAFVSGASDEALHNYLRVERAVVGTLDVLACSVARAKSATASDHVKLVDQAVTGYRRIFEYQKMVKKEQIQEQEEENNVVPSSSAATATPGGSHQFEEIYTRLCLDICLLVGACSANTFELNSKALQLLCEIVVVEGDDDKSSSSSSAARLPAAHCSKVLNKLATVVTLLEREEDAAVAFGALLFCLIGCGSAADTNHSWKKCVAIIRDAHLTVTSSTSDEQQSNKTKQQRLHALPGVLIPRWHRACRALAMSLMEMMSNANNSNNNSNKTVTKVDSHSWCDTTMSIGASSLDASYSPSSSASSTSSALPPMNIQWIARSFALTMSVFSPADQIFVGFVQEEEEQEEDVDDHNNDDNNNKSSPNRPKITPILIQGEEGYKQKQRKQLQKLRFATLCASVYSDIASIFSRTHLDASNTLLWLGNPVVRAVKLLIKNPPLMNDLMMMDDNNNSNNNNNNTTQQHEKREQNKILAADAFDFAMTCLEVITTLGRRLQASTHNSTIVSWSLLTEQALMNVQWCQQIFSNNTFHQQQAITANKQKAKLAAESGGGDGNGSNNIGIPEVSSNSSSPRNAEDSSSSPSSSASLAAKQKLLMQQHNKKLLAAAAAVIASRRRNSSASLSNAVPNLPAAEETTRFLVNFEKIIIDCKNVITWNQIYLNVLLEFIPIVLGNSVAAGSHSIQQQQQQQSQPSLGSSVSNLSQTQSFVGLTSPSLAAFHPEETHFNFSFIGNNNNNLENTLGGTITSPRSNRMRSTTFFRENGVAGSTTSPKNSPSSATGGHTSKESFAIYNIPDKLWATLCHHLCVAASTDLIRKHVSPGASAYYWDMIFAQLAQHISTTIASPLSQKAAIITSVASTVFHARCSHERDQQQHLHQQHQQQHGKVTMARHMTMIANAVMGEVREKLPLIAQVAAKVEASNNAAAENATSSSSTTTTTNNATEDKQQQSNPNNNNNSGGTATATTAAADGSSSSAPSDQQQQQQQQLKRPPSAANNPSIAILKGIVSVIHSIFLFPWDHLYIDGGEQDDDEEQNNDNMVEKKKTAQVLMNCVSTLGSLADALSSNINDQEMLHPRLGPDALLNEQNLNFIQLMEMYRNNNNKNKTSSSIDPSLFFCASAGPASMGSSSSFNSTNSQLLLRETSSSSSLLLIMYYWVTRLTGRISALIANFKEKQESASTRESNSTTIEYVYKKRKLCTEVCARLANHAAALPITKETYPVRLAGLELFYQIMVGFRHFNQLPTTTDALSSSSSSSSSSLSSDYFPDESMLIQDAARVTVFSVGSDRIVTLIQMKAQYDDDNTAATNKSSTNFPHSDFAKIIVIVRSSFGRSTFKFSRIPPTWSSVLHDPSSTVGGGAASLQQQKPSFRNNMILYDDDGNGSGAGGATTTTTKTPQPPSSPSTSSLPAPASASTLPRPNSVTSIGSSASIQSSTMATPTAASLLSSRQQRSGNNIVVVDPLVHGATSSSSGTANNKSINDKKKTDEQEQQQQLADTLYEQLFGRPPEIPILLQEQQQQRHQEDPSSSSTTIINKHLPTEDDFPLLRVLAREYTQQSSDGSWKLLSLNHALISQLKGLDLTLKSLPELSVLMLVNDDDDDDENDESDDNDETGGRNSTTSVLFRRFMLSLGVLDKKDKECPSTVTYKSERRGAMLKFTTKNNSKNNNNNNNNNNHRVIIQFEPTPDHLFGGTKNNNNRSPSTSTKKKQKQKNGKNHPNIIKARFTTIFVSPLPHSDNYVIVVDGGDAARITNRSPLIFTPASCARFIHDVCFLHVTEYLVPSQMVMRREALRRVIEVAEPFRKDAPSEATSANVVMELMKQNEIYQD